MRSNLRDATQREETFTCYSAYAHQKLIQLDKLLFFLSDFEYQLFNSQPIPIVKFKEKSPLSSQHP